MPHEDAELDYLAGTQPYENPASFERVVKEAFLLELDCSQNQDIADVLGVDKSRISQIFGSPSNLKPETIQKLLDHLKSKEHKRMIVEAWMRECFGDEILYQTGQPTVGKRITEKTIRRIDRQIRESRLSLAAKTAIEAVERTEDAVMRERLLDRAFFARQRLDQPGQAMQIARRIIEAALDRKDYARAAAGYCMAGRVLRGMADSRERETLHLLDRSEALLSLAGPPPQTPPPYVLVNIEVLQIERINLAITLLERKEVVTPEKTVQGYLVTVVSYLKAAKSYQTRSRLLQLQARIHLRLGEAFQAQECLEKSFNAGDIKNLNSYEVSGVVNGRILAHTEGPEGAIEYLEKVIENCINSHDYYHQRLAEYDLARLERQLMVELRLD